MSPLPCTAHRGQSGIEKSSWRSVLGSATECAHRMRRRDELRQRGSLSTYFRMAYFVVRAVEGARVVARLAPLAVDHTDTAALDLHDDDAGTGDDRHDVSLVVLHLIAEPKVGLSLIHISEPTRLGMISYAV